MKPRKHHKHQQKIQRQHQSRPTSPQKETQAKALFVLDMLDGNDWRHLTLTHEAALKLIRRTNHRGYTLTPCTPAD